EHRGDNCAGCDPGLDPRREPAHAFTVTVVLKVDLGHDFPLLVQVTDANIEAGMEGRCGRVHSRRKLTSMHGTGCPGASGHRRRLMGMPESQHLKSINASSSRPDRSSYRAIISDPMIYFTGGGRGTLLSEPWGDCPGLSLRLFGRAESAECANLGK